MISVLYRLDGCPERTFAAEEVLIREGDKTNRIFVLSEGEIEVFRDEVSIAIVSEPGAVFGEMSALLNIPHTANVRARKSSTLFVIDSAREFLRSRPELAFPIAKLLAERLQHATSYLVDLKKQFADRADHFGMVDEVLEALIHAPPQDFSAPDVGPREQLTREGPKS